MILRSESAGPAGKGFRPSWFRFKAQDDKAPETLGFIAQDVQEVAPSLVTSGDTLSLNYAGMSTIAIVRRETGGWKWPLFQLGYMTGTAYVLSLLVFQIGTAMGY